MSATKSKKTLIVVVGPTAVGKTAMAILLARHLRTEIISADSRQFYREMSIGTAKPDPAELATATHHFINSHAIATEYSAGDFERDALHLLKRLFQEKDNVIMVGGSGLFVRAVTEGLDDLPKAPAELRDALNREFAEKGLTPLKDRLRQVDPQYYATADIDNPQRVIRALEIYESTGKPISSYQTKKNANRDFDIVTIGLNMEREKLYNRINLRVDKMMEMGLLDEVRSLLPYRNKPALLTVGYAEIFTYLDGEVSGPQAIDSIKQNSRRYAKRQITWFKKYGNTNWFEPTDTEAILHFIAQRSRRD
jgi:tRNA dimethylallyltransferase